MKHCYDNTNIDFSQEYHNFSAVWTPFKIMYYLDDELIHTAYQYYVSKDVGLDVDCGEIIPSGDYKVNPAFPLRKNRFRPILWVFSRPKCRDQDWLGCDNLFFEPYDTPCDEIDYPFEYSGVQHLEDYPNETHYSSVKVTERTYYFCDADDFLVDHSLTISGNHNYGDITVKNGATLTISGAYLKFGSGARITIEPGSNIQIFNSTLTAICNKWRGIRSSAWGMSQSDVVILNSTIEKAEKGLRIDGSSSCTIENSIIRECDIGLYFYNANYPKEIKGNTTFEENGIGIWAYLSKGIKVKDCDFNIVSKEHISVIETEIDISGGNTFNRAPGYSVAARATYPGSSAAVYIGHYDNSKNVFNRNHDGIFAAGVDNPIGVEVVNNKFIDHDDTGTKFYGDNKALFQNNTVTTGMWGVVFDATGEYNHNKDLCNVFTDVEIAESAFNLNNNRTTFLSNNSFGWENVADFIVEGAVNPLIGSPLDAAGNCFTDPADAIDILTTSNSTHFDYFYKEQQNQGCDFSQPIHQGNYSTNRAQKGNIICNRRGVFNKISPGSDGQYSFPGDFVFEGCLDNQCLLDSVTAWINRVVLIGGDDPRTALIEGDTTPNFEVLENEETLDQWINYLLFLAYQREDYALADAVLSPLVTWHWQKRKFGLKMHLKDYEAASTLLENMPENNQNQIYFKDVERLNIKRLQGYTMTEDEILELREIALSDFSSKGFAHSIYYLVTGQHLSVNPISMPYSYNNYYQSKNIFHNSGLLKVYPNPAMDVLSVETINQRLLQRITLYDLTGKLILNIATETNLWSIDISNLSRGIYSLTVQFLDGSEEHRLVRVR